jgi:tether containing UBX domain for GLUT4
MSHTSLWLVGLNKRTQIPVESANTPLYNILKQFCEKYELDPNKYELQPSIKKGNKALDLSLPFRLSGLAKNATVEVLPKVQSGGSKTQTVEKATLGLQLPDGNRQRAVLPLNTSLWDALIHFETENKLNLTHQVSNKGIYQIPGLQFMNQNFATINSLKNTKISGLGLQNGGNALMRLTYIDSGKSLQDMEEEINAIVEEPKISKDIPAPTPSIPVKPSTSTPTTTHVSRPIPTEPAPKKISNDEEYDNPIKMTDDDVDDIVPEKEEQPQQPPAPTLPLEGVVAIDVKLFKVDESRPVEDVRALGFTDKDFEISRSELQKIYLEEQKRKEDSMILKTRKIREIEAQEREKARVYDKTIIRIRFPSGLILQGTFKPKNKVQRIVELVKASIENPDTPFFIYVTPPIQRLDDRSKTLKEVGLVPAALVNVALDKKIAKTGDREPTLKKDLLQYLATLPSHETVPTNLKGTEQEAVVMDSEEDVDINMEKSKSPEEPPQLSSQPQPQPVKSTSTSQPKTGGRTLGGSGVIPKWFRPQ